MLQVRLVGTHPVLRIVILISYLFLLCIGLVVNSCFFHKMRLYSLGLFRSWLRHKIDQLETFMIQNMLATRNQNLKLITFQDFDLTNEALARVLDTLSANVSELRFYPFGIEYEMKEFLLNYAEILYTLLVA